MVSSSNGSEIVDVWIEAGCDGELRASEKTEKSQDEHGVKRVGGVDGMVPSVEGGNTFSQYF